MTPAPRLVHLTTTDMSLVLLLGPQLRAFAQAGYEVFGVSAQGPYVAELESWGIRHVPLRHATRALAPGRDLRALAEVHGVFRELRPAIVHTHNPKPGVYGRLAARAASVPIVINTVHGLYAQPDDPRLRRTVVYGLERVAARCSHAELVQNPEDIEVLLAMGVPRAKLHLLGNGVDLDRFDRRRTPTARVAAVRAELGAGPDDVVCGVVGRLVAEKGYREIFEAARLLRTSAPQVHVVVIGPHDPDKADAISETEMARAASEGGVRFLGLRRDVEELYPAMDVYAIASYREGFPRSAMEAAAMALPIVATDIRGCRQVVESGVTGLLVRPRDAGALATAVTTLASDTALRTRMGDEAERKARRQFDQRRVIEITLDVYERCRSKPVQAAA